MKEIHVKVESICPMLMHRFPEEDEEPKVKRKTGVINYKEEFEKSLYKDEDGTIYMPSTWFEQSMVKAAVNFPIPGKGKKTFKDLVNSALIVLPEKIPIDPQEYKIDKRSVRIGRSRVFRYRPRWDHWQAEFTIIIFDEQLPVSTLKQILEYAGAYKGVGDYRPKFGRFQIVKFEEKNKDA